MRQQLLRQYGVLKKNHQFEGENRLIILNMIALFAIRNMHVREAQDEFINTVSRLMLSMTASAPVGSKVNGMEITPQSKSQLLKFKDALDKGEYKITATRTSHIKRELESMDSILPYLVYRKWTLIVAPNDTNFITSDHPVILIWKDSSIYPRPPGFALTNTQIFFPLSKKLALVGDFEGNEETVLAGRKLVAEVNSNVIIFAKSQIYASRPDFYFIHSSKEVVRFQEAYWAEIKR